MTGYPSKHPKKNNSLIFLSRALIVLIFSVILFVILGMFFMAVFFWDTGHNKQQPLLFAVSKPSIENATPPIDESENPVYLSIPDFISDLSEYEKYMDPDGDEYLTLINSQNTLDEDYMPPNLTDVVDTRKDGRNTQKMQLYAAKALEALLIEARANGISDVTVTSAYRSYAYQKQLFDARVEQYMYLGYEEAYKKAATINAIPGSSEHQSGLCCDMHNISAADVSFAKTEAAAWLADNSWKFGFILRYPMDKTEITGISFEPWHFRYIGRYHAKAIYDAGICLEEYVEQLKK